MDIEKILSLTMYVRGNLITDFLPLTSVFRLMRCEMRIITFAERPVTGIYLSGTGQDFQTQAYENVNNIPDSFAAYFFNCLAGKGLSSFAFRYLFRWCDHEYQVDPVCH